MSFTMLNALRRTAAIGGIAFVAVLPLASCNDAEEQNEEVETQQEDGGEMQDGGGMEEGED